MIKKYFQSKDFWAKFRIYIKVGFFTVVLDSSCVSFIFYFTPRIFVCLSSFWILMYAISSQSLTRGSCPFVILKKAIIRLVARCCCSLSTAILQIYHLCSSIIHQVSHCYITSTKWFFIFITMETFNETITS